MGVEILILSGSRQGQQFELDLDTFRAGGDKSCDIYFDPARDASAEGRVASFQRTDEGWYIRNAGSGELLLNQEAVFSRERIRSGDIVRLSDRGPDFSFEITTGRDIPAGITLSNPDPEKSGDAGKPATARTVLTEIKPADALQNGVKVESTLPPIVLPRAKKKPAALITVAVSIAVLALAAIIVSAFVIQSENAETIVPIAADSIANEPNAPQADPAANLPPHVEPAVKETKSPTSAQTETTKPPVEEKVPDAVAVQALPEDPWATLAERLAKSVWLLRVGDAEGKFVYPFATAIAVDEHTLLTTASVAVELDNFKAKGWKITAANAALKKDVPIWKIRVHAVYPTFADSRVKQIYVDAAVLETMQNLGPQARLASESELAQLDTGSPLGCIGIPHLGDAVKAGAGTSSPKLFRGKLFLKTRLDPNSPSGPRLLHFKAPLDKNMFGSPIVNQDGHVVAIYSETAASGEGRRLGIHYAPVLNPALVQKALEGKYERFWVSPQNVIVTHASAAENRPSAELRKDSNGSKAE